MPAENVPRFGRQPEEPIHYPAAANQHPATVCVVMPSGLVSPAIQGRPRLRWWMVGRQPGPLFYADVPYGGAGISLSAECHVWLASDENPAGHFNR